MSLIAGCPEIDSEEVFYGKADEYWRSIPSTLDGMLGGYSRISGIDVQGSKIFLKKFLKGPKNPKGKTNNRRALDCGAGIGRVSKLLLLPLFETVDLVELNPDFLKKAESYLESSADRVGNYFCSGLQSFHFTQKYDVIWLQWVTGHLTDEHFVSFLERCKEALHEDGIVVIKDNTAQVGRCEHDQDDSSVTRNKDELHAIYKRAGLKILSHQKQNNFPSELYLISMTALGA